MSIAYILIGFLVGALGIITWGLLDRINSVVEQVNNAIFWNAKQITALETIILKHLKKIVTDDNQVKLAEEYGFDLVERAYILKQNDDRLAEQEQN